GYTFMDIFDADPFSSECQHNLYYLFSSKTEWQFASWLSNSGLSMAAIDKILSLDIAHFCSLPFMSADTVSFRSNHAPFHSKQQECFADLLNYSPPGPDGMFYWDAIKCLQHLVHLLSNNGQIEFMPKRIYSAADCMQHVYTEWLMGDRARELQDALPDGTTLLGVVLSSNITHITQVGNHQAHLLLISLANISADIHAKGSMK
ncbi:hypothetical protein F5141DRAFT_1000268, partial [Pisolithus sp. B1]